MRWRNLRQLDVAEMVGIFSPQLKNALRGRLGVGPEAVERLKALNQLESDDG